MESAGRAIDCQLKLDLSDADFMALVRSRGESADAARSPRLGSDSRTNVIARYSATLDTLTLTGMLRRGVLVRLALKSGSRTYANFIRLLLRELNAMTAHSLTNGSGEMSREARRTVQQLKRHLEKVLEGLCSETLLNTQELSEIVDLYRGDFEPSGEAERHARRPSWELLHDGLRVVDETTGEAIVSAPWSSDQRTFRFFGDKTPQLISGFFGLGEEETTAEPDPTAADWIAAAADWRRSLRFDSVPELQIEEHGVRVSASIYLPASIAEQADVFIHWGPKTAGAIWHDEEFSFAERAMNSDGSLRLSKLLVPETVGRFGACFCVALRGTGQRAWSGSYGINDLEFEATSQIVNSKAKLVRERRLSDAAVKSKLLQSLSSFGSFVRLAGQLVRKGNERRLGALLHEVTRDDQELRSLAAHYYDEAVFALESDRPELPAAFLRRAVRLVSNVGIGEIVFVSPEGPHAIAGGLAQVIVGLTKSLAGENICSTVITPLYEDAQGSKHRSADEVIEQGVPILGQMVPLREAGIVKIPFGESRVSGTTQVKQFPRVVPATVYLAEYGGIRMFFLRHPALADALYRYSSSEDQLRKAVFLSRGALELIKDRRFGICPDTIVSNDWPTALVPAMLRCDDRYRGRGSFADAQTAHIIHNAGPAFQGRFYVNLFGEDLWPLLGLDDQHFFGLADPANRDYMNLTAGAVLHSSKAVVTVSKPYAEQLLTKEGGEGLHELLQQRRDIVFGISNGVDLQALRGTFRELGEEARATLGMAPALRGRRVSESRFVAKLHSLKRASKTAVQKKFGLEPNKEAVLISLVGRLTEQKGVQLLTGRAQLDGMTVLEAVLQHFSDVQFLVAGPVCRDEHETVEFERRFLNIQERYPTRMRGVFDFIPHRDALEITHASDFFLMPSRYEPGGITQLEALAAGTLVIAHNVGGIAATLSDYSCPNAPGTSFLFNHFSSAALQAVMWRALSVFTDRRRRQELIAQAALSRNDWSDRVPTYLALLQHVSGALSTERGYGHLRNRAQLLDTVRPAAVR